jgi:hypothetical protein
MMMKFLGTVAKWSWSLRQLCIDGSFRIFSPILFIHMS